MNKQTQSILIALLGGLMIAITMSGRYTSYVIPRFGPLLIAGGAVLVLLGVVGLVIALRSEHREQREQRERLAVGGSHTKPGDAEHEHDAHRPDAHGHDHDRSRAPWLLLAPVLVLLVVAPAALGADAVTRYATSQAVAGATDPAGDANRRTQVFAPLPAGDPPELTLQEFVLRALYDEQESVTGTPVAVVGFIVPDPDGYTIARIAISCCAADGDPIRVHVRAAPPYPANTWVRAVVTAVPDSGTPENGYVPVVVPQSIELIEQPADPYLVARYG